MVIYQMQHYVHERLLNCGASAQFGAACGGPTVGCRRRQTAGGAWLLGPVTSTHPLFHIESNNDPGLSRPSWSYKSFYCVPDLLRAFEVIWGGFCISITYLTTRLRSEPYFHSRSSFDEVKQSWKRECWNTTGAKSGSGRIRASLDESIAASPY